MKRNLLVILAACGGGGAHEPDAAMTNDGKSIDAPMIDGAKTGYALTRVTGGCDTLTNPMVLPLDGFVHATDIFQIPFALPFFGSTMTRFSVVEQGQLLLFDNGSATITTLVDPLQIPNPAAPNGFAAPLWTPHLGFVVDRSAINAGVVDQHATIEWSDFAVTNILPDQTSHVTFQAKLFRDGAIELDYCTLDPGNTTSMVETGAQASIGLESPDGAAGVSAGFQTANAVDTATGLRFTPQ